MRRARQQATAAATMLLLIACAASGCGGSGKAEPSADGKPATTTVRWTYDWLPTSGDVPVLAAQQQGYFKEAGLNVKITPGGEADQIQLVGTGQQDITLGPASQVIQTHAKNLPVTSVGLVQPVSPAGLICRPDRGIDANDPKSLEGKKIGIQPEQSYHAEFLVWAQAAGVDASRMKQIPVGFDPAVMFQGQVDCFPDFLTLNVVQAEEVFHKPPVTFLFADHAHSIGQVLVANNSFLKKHPEAVKGFVTAYAKGMQWALRNRADAVTLLTTTYDDMKPAVVSKELPLLQRFWVGDAQREKGLLWQDAALWQPEYDTLKQHKFLEGGDFDLGELIGPASLPNPPVLP